MLAVPYDMPIPGYRNGTVNTLRLWKAAATDEFDLGEFNAGSYTEVGGGEECRREHHHGALSQRRQRKRQGTAPAPAVFPRLGQPAGRAAPLGDAITATISAEFAEKNCFQLNDTHPTCAVPELMRLLMDEHGLDWDEAWEITRRTMAYTNHTLLPEALEKWPVRCSAAAAAPAGNHSTKSTPASCAEVSQPLAGRHRAPARACRIIEEGTEPQVRMAYLAIVGSFSVNGVAALHSQLLQQGLFRDFYELWPHKFNNKTNGVTPRRWLACVQSRH